jgi:hypothetical protein
VETRLEDGDVLLAREARKRGAELFTGRGGRMRELWELKKVIEINIFLLYFTILCLLLL